MSGRRRSPVGALGSIFPIPSNENIPRVPSVPAPRFPRFKHMPQDPFNVTEIHMVVHLGTHVDSPRHFFNDGPAFDEIPLDRFYGPAVAWRIEAEPYQVIERADLSRMRPELRPGDILLLDSTWSELVGAQSYEQHPHLSEAAAEWLVEQSRFPAVKTCCPASSIYHFPSCTASCLTRSCRSASDRRRRSPPVYKGASAHREKSRRNGPGARLGGGSVTRVPTSLLTKSRSRKAKPVRVPSRAGSVSSKQFTPWKTVHSSY